MKKFGIRFRSQSIFCTGDIQSAKQYGEIAVIEPIGDFEICWSPKCHDLIEIEDYPWMSIEEFIIENEYQIGNLQKAIKSCNEIMLFCEKYKVVSYE
ncbi:MAG: hypothetical protein DSY46_00480 [Hydrogenimonas sp.]|nr:MAG: hypothetical protein DSY46_00480 [Hydrogenimonas sp.]